MTKEIIDFDKKNGKHISEEEASGAIWVEVGIGDLCPTELALTDNNIVLGSLERSQARYVIDVLRRIADAIEDETTKQSELIGRLNEFDDNDELSEAVIEIAEREGVDANTRYWLKEAECNMRGLYDLAKTAIYRREQPLPRR